MITTRAKLASWFRIPVAWPRRARTGKDLGIELLLVLGLVVAGLATFAIDQWLELQKPRNPGFPANPNPMAQFAGLRSRHTEISQMWKKVSQSRALRIEGKPASDFALPDASTGHKVRLGVLRRNKPVLLLFGSFG